MCQIPEPLLQRYVDACVDVFGADDVVAIVLHGSAYKGGHIAGFSDVDFMTFVSSRAFDDYGLRADLAFAIRDRSDAIDWRAAGASHFQAYYYDPDRVPEWWTGPIPGAHRVLYGAVPQHLIATADRLLESGRRLLLDDLPAQLRNYRMTISDSHADEIPRRVRLIGTSVSPAVYALLSRHTHDPLAAWRLPKFEALAALARHAPAAAATARLYYDRAGAFFGKRLPHDTQEALDAFAAGMEALTALHQAARSRYG